MIAHFIDTAETRPTYVSELDKSKGFQNHNYSVWCPGLECLNLLKNYPNFTLSYCLYLVLILLNDVWSRCSHIQINPNTTTQKHAMRPKSGRNQRSNSKKRITHNYSIRLIEKFQQILKGVQLEMV